ncbi:MAG: NUDIX domain-containing protein [Succinivibrionaceae bacterium]
MIYYYGGTFDPITKAHEAIIRRIKKEMRESDKLIIGIVQNDEKNYNVSVNDRLNMVKKSLDAHEIVIQDKRTYEYLDAHYRGEKITICMGDDEWYALCSGKWVNWDLLLKCYEFFVFDREVHDREDKDDVIVLPAGINPTVTFLGTGDTTDGISSTAVREILFKNPECHYSDVRDYITHVVFRYIKDNELYFQNGNDYNEKEKEFLKEYAVKKEKNHWGEPSVTTDTVAYNGDKILLIRRGNYPYKNYWALPGGFFEKTDEDLNFGAQRELKEETGIDIDPKYFRQIKTYGHNFDPRMKIVDVAFSVRVSKKDMNKVKGLDDACDARWFQIDELPKLGFHHEQIINDFLKEE